MIALADLVDVAPPVERSITVSAPQRIDQLELFELLPRRR
jgi:hypothetical protein